MYPIRTLLVPTDLSPEDEPVLDRAFELARQTGARVHLLHVFDSLLRDLPPGDAESEATRALRMRMQTVARDALDRVAARRADEGVRVTTEQRLAPAPAPAIVACARDISADLIMMGTHERGGLHRLLFGSVAETVRAMRPCPVDVVPRAPVAARWGGSLDDVRERLRQAFV